MDFQEGDFVLMWDKRREKPRMHKKFDSLWLGPYQIKEISRVDSFYSTTVKGRRIPLPVNGSLLKPYFFDRDLISIGFKPQVSR
jgi:hypothetical protein